MRMVRSTVFGLALLLAATAASAGTIIPFSSSGFSHDNNVRVPSPPDTLAVFKQSTSSNVVALWNDPSPTSAHQPLIVAQKRMILLFDYVLYEHGTDTGNAEQIWAGITDITDGTALGGQYQFKADMFTSGTVAFDLSDLVGQTVGIRFEMRPHPTTLDVLSNGHLNVSNLRTTIVPVPAASLLALPPLCALLIWRASRRRKPR